MERATPDRRIRRTKAQLCAALNQLLAEKPPEEITVTELTRLADVNRGTFYSHYKDVPDMVEQMEAELFAEFAQLMDAYSAKELRQGLGPILEDVFSYIQRSFGPVPIHALKADPAFLARVKGLLREKVTREWNGLYSFTDTEQREFYLTFLVGGVVGLIQLWMEGGRTESPQKMAALTESLILHGIQPQGKL